MTIPPTIPAAAARRLFMAGQGLLADPGRAATPARVLAEIRALGFVQLDSINIVERAHHHILWSRLRDYRPPALDALQRRGQVFEHWTHDASILPTEVFPHWRARFGHVAWGSWLRGRMGKDHETVARRVLDRIRAEGPLMARDFVPEADAGGAARKSGPWWDWKPAKAALEYWWRTGHLAIPHRINFHKVYDLTERVLPKVHALPAPPREEHIDWACRGALERLGAATPKELAGFWGTVTIDEARAWCRAAIARGDAIAVTLEPAAAASKDSRITANGTIRSRAVGRNAAAATRRPADSAVASRPLPAVALRDWRDRAAALPDPPETMRILSPFDPLIRDRARALRLFKFDYRFEAFVPESKRTHGYYVLPVLQSDRLIARLDPKMDRDAGTLHVRNIWWEHKPARADRAALTEALHRYAALQGAADIRLPATGAHIRAPGVSRG